MHKRRIGEWGQETLTARTWIWPHLTPSTDKAKDSVLVRWNTLQLRVRETESESLNLALSLHIPSPPHCAGPSGHWAPLAPGRGRDWNPGDRKADGGCSPSTLKNLQPSSPSQLLP